MRQSRAPTDWEDDARLGQVQCIDCWDSIGLTASMAAQAQYNKARPLSPNKEAVRGRKRKDQTNGHKEQ